MDEKQPLLNNENQNQVVDIERGGEETNSQIIT